MTILTDNSRFLLLNVDIEGRSGSFEPNTMHVIFRSAADHVHEVQVLQFAFASSLEWFQGVFSARSRKRSGGGAHVSIKNQVSAKIENSIAMC